mmetsp:Transcript_15317/g.20197  ORF Transcript_15317/g.20197 Transcript_15317/m.20197 type:complete len:91 (+) Transcript_15317:1400-1672(+)
MLGDLVAPLHIHGFISYLLYQWRHHAIAWVTVENGRNRCAVPMVYVFASPSRSSTKRWQYHHYLDNIAMFLHLHECVADRCLYNNGLASC